MRFAKCIGILAAVLAVGETMTYGYQRVDLPGVKPQTKQESPVPVEFITVEELKAKIAKSEPIAIVDLRQPSVFTKSDVTIKGAVHTKVRRVASRLRDIPRDREVVTYCACPSDEAATIGARALIADGFTRVRVLKGGWSAWVQAGGQLQPRKKTS